jgi:hypothetical protein
MIETFKPIVPPPLPPATPDFKPRVWPAFVAFVALLVLEIVVATGVVVALTFFKYGIKLKLHDVVTESQSAPGLLTSFVGTMALAAGLALAGAWLSPMFWRDRLRLRRVPLRLPILLAGTLGVMSVGMLVSALMELHWLPQSNSLDVLDHMLQGLSAPGAVLAVLLLGLLPGLVEELLFRGYIQSRLVARWGAGWGIFCTALMFGISHLDLMQGAFAVGVGCILGFITVRTGSIVPAMICHAANNTLSMVLSVTGGDDHPGRGVSLIMLLVGLVLLPLALLYLRARLPAAPGKLAA